MQFKLNPIMVDIRAGWGSLVNPMARRTAYRPPLRSVASPRRVRRARSRK